MDVHELYRIDDVETLDLLRRLRDRADDDGRAEREIVALVIDLLGPRPIPALAAYRRLVEHYLPWMELRLVRRARRQGCSWAGIGRVLHRSRQALHRRFDRRLPIDALLPPAPLTPPSTVELAREAAAEQRRMDDIDRAGDDGDLVPW